MSQLGNYPNGALWDVLNASMSSDISMEARGDAINQLLKERRITMLVDAMSGANVFKLVPYADWDKIRELSDEKFSIYRYIEETGTQGILKRSLTRKVGMRSNLLNKALEQLTKDKIIKPFRSIQSKIKRRYILDRLTPHPDHRGGVWYNAELEFDHEFVDHLSHETYELIKLKGFVSAKDVRNNLNTKSPSELQEADVVTLLHTLVYDGRIEMFPSPQNPDLILYKVSRGSPKENGLTSSPCGACPVADKCTDDPNGNITPYKCVYLKDWLESGLLEI
mmetsp:Transcript_18061/g.20114  ORF Transcript_18061/g.20114 Transcript_18061/m.20114 type:complete len:279 (-) Transcript_18061:47-883(-)